MAKDKEGLVGWLTQLGEWAEELAAEINKADKKESAEAETVPKRDFDALLAEATRMGRQRDELERQRDAQRRRLQTALAHFHGPQHSAATGSLVMDQVVDVVVKTLRGELKPPKGWPKQIVDTNDERVASLRNLVRDLETQQAADTNTIATLLRTNERQEREIERLKSELEHAEEPMA